LYTDGTTKSAPSIEEKTLTFFTDKCQVDFVRASRIKVHGT
jgi:hypothetical protein